MTFRSSLRLYAELFQQSMQRLQSVPLRCKLTTVYNDYHTRMLNKCREYLCLDLKKSPEITL